ncbi:MAG TPA: phage holin family protein [Flavobacterium sp.]|jgi:putative membrane protein
MNLILRILLTAVLVLLISRIMPGVTVDNFMTSVIVAIVLGLLNLFVKPVLVIFTLPVTLLTFGIFLLVINALVILLCDELVAGFTVRSFWYALLFSIVLSVFQSLVFSLGKRSRSDSKR